MSSSAVGVLVSRKKWRQRWAVVPPLEYQPHVYAVHAGALLQAVWHWPKEVIESQSSM